MKQPDLLFSWLHFLASIQTSNKPRSALFSKKKKFKKYPFNLSQYCFCTFINFRVPFSSSSLTPKITEWKQQSSKTWEWIFFVMNTVINYDYKYVLYCRCFLVEEFIISHAQNKIERTIWKFVINERNSKWKNQNMSSIRVEFEHLKINVWKCTPSKVVSDVFHCHKKVFTKTTN